MEIGTIIRELRVERGLTQEQLAERIGVTFQAVSKWENGTGLPDISQVVPLARAFEVGTDVLFGTQTAADGAARLAEYRERKRALVQDVEDYRTTEKQVLELVREMAREFPRDEDIKRELAARLVNDDENKPENFREALAIADKLLAESGDERILREAKHIRIHALGGDGGREAAFAEADKQPNLNYTREQVIMDLVYNEYEKGTSELRDLARLRGCIVGYWQKIVRALSYVRLVERQLGIVNNDERLEMLNIEEHFSRLYIAWDADGGLAGGSGDEKKAGRGDKSVNEANIERLQCLRRLRN